MTLLETPLENNALPMKESGMLFTGYLKEDLQHILKSSGNPSYTPALLNSVDDTVQTLTKYQHTEKNGCMLTGSIARYMTGNGDPQTNWEIRASANTVAQRLHNPSNVAALEVISKAEQDMDINFNFSEQGSIADLYEYLKETAQGATETAKQEQASDETRPYDRKILRYTDQHGINVEIEFGHVRVRREIVHLKIVFSNGENKVFHVDIAEFPKSGLQAADEGRAGGLTMDSQDLFLPITIDENGKTKCNHEQHINYSMLHKENIKVKGQKPQKIVELSMRALRIHLIHSKELFRDTSVQSLTPVFAADKLFEIRQSIQLFVQSGKKLSSYNQKQLETELLISLANNPYTTAKYIQDTGLYLLVPGLRTMNSADWKKLFISDAFAFPKPGQNLSDSKQRGMIDVKDAQDEFNKHPWSKNNNGILMFLRAFGEVQQEKFPSLDPTDYDALYSLLVTPKTTEHTPTIAWEGKENLRKTIMSVLKTFSSGVTEKEIHTYISGLTDEQITREDFRKALFSLKTKGIIDKQRRLVGDKQAKIEGDQQWVTFYSPRLTPRGRLIHELTPLTNFEMSMQLSAITLPDVDTKTTRLLELAIPNLSCKSVESFRPLRDYDFNYLVSEMRELINPYAKRDLSDEVIKQYLVEVQKSCFAYKRKRGSA